MKKIKKHRLRKFIVIMVLVLSAVYAFSQMGMMRHASQRRIRTIDMNVPLQSLEQNIGEIYDVVLDVPARVEASIARVEDFFD